MRLSKRLLKNFYLQEVIIFCAMFVLTMLHEWIMIDSMMSFIKGMVFFILLYGQAQIHRFFIFPLFVHKRFLNYGLVTVTATLAGACVLFVANYYWLQPDCYADGDLWMGFIYQFVICLISTFTILSISFMRQYAVEMQKRSDEQLLLNEMHIKLLSAQLNPHFFFNMLNNLYGVSLANPERAPQLIVMLSELMRYQIENVKKQSVSLAEELKFIQNYVELEKERVGKRCEIKLNVSIDPLLREKFEIAPLLLITLVENSFKHSNSSVFWFVHITLTFDENQLKMDVQNSCRDTAHEQNSTGIGLENLRKRLNLLYPNGYTLASSKNEHKFQTSLTIKLNTK